MAVNSGQNPRRGAEQLYPTLLFFVFLLCTIFTILIGSRVYENIRARDNASFRADTALAYMTNKVRQNDIAGMISIREDNGYPVLVLANDFDGVFYETWIYQMDGALWELFTQAGSGVDVYGGQRIMDCGPVSFALEEQAQDTALLTISLEDTREASLLLRSGRKGGRD